MNARNSSIANDRWKATSARIIPGSVLNRPSACSSQMVGTTAGGMISPDSTKKPATLDTRPGRRCSTNAAIEAKTTSSATEATVITVLLT